MNREFTDAEMEHIMNTINNGLRNIFGDSAEVHCIKGSTD